MSSFHFQIIALKNSHFEFLPSVSQFWPVFRRMTHICVFFVCVCTDVCVFVCVLMCFCVCVYWCVCAGSQNIVAWALNWLVVDLSLRSGTWSQTTPTSWSHTAHLSVSTVSLLGWCHYWCFGSGCDGVAQALIGWLQHWWVDSSIDWLAPAWIGWLQQWWVGSSTDGLGWFQHWWFGCSSGGLAPAVVGWLQQWWAGSSSGGLAPAVMGWLQQWWAGSSSDEWWAGSSTDESRGKVGWS